MHTHFYKKAILDIKYYSSFSNINQFYKFFPRLSSFYKI